MWHDLIAEPYLWLQYCFFQPVRFQQEIAAQALGARLKMMLRLTPLLFFYSYTPAILLRIIIYTLHPGFYPDYMLHSFTPLNMTVGWFLFDATWAAAVSCFVGALIGGLFSVRFGIALSLALSLANGIIVNTNSDTLVGIIFGIGFGLMLGITFNSANAVKQGGLENVTIASIIGISSGLIIGYLTGTFGGYWAGFAVGTIYPALRHIDNIGGSTAGIFVGGVAGCFLAALVGTMLRKHVRAQWIAPVSFGVRVGIAVATAFGSAIGIPVGDSGESYDPIIKAIAAGTVQAGIVGIAFLFFYLLSYYRLPLYPFSAYSTLRAYFASRGKHWQALYCLKESSLHWDECVFLPLPYLKSMLLLAAEESLAGTLEELNFIVEERPQQRWAAQATAYELVLRDLQHRTILRDIGLAHQQLALLLPPNISALNTSAEKIFRNLDNASREAASYHTQTNKKDRQVALERMIHYIKDIHLHSAFSTMQLNEELQAVVNQWCMLAEQGLETLGSMSGNLSIDNPYAPGNPLELRDPLFVGRDDIVQKLGQALQKRYRPTFILTGERRMGKSSILKQLPLLLGPRYFPVFYDLQSTGVLTNTATLFAAIATGIEQQLQERGILPQKLERSQLDEALQQSETAVYDRFGQWLQGVEQVLEQEDRMIILAFDECEKLEDAENKHSINLILLFDWFRSIMQNHARVVILFSGAKMAGDFGRSWASYFVNVERIKVGFLRDAAAHELIVHPVPHIFNEEVTLEIMRVTHCHPFLIQAMCKQIIEQLNDDAREQATREDVPVAIEEVFESWYVYFWDLWDRCDSDQRMCLLALLAPTPASVGTISQRTSLNQQRTLLALEKLQMRDMVLHDNDVYQLAVPLFSQWIEQQQRLLDPGEE
jgi:uncharacterized protein